MSQDGMEKKGDQPNETDSIRSHLIMRFKQSDYEVKGLNLSNFIDKDFLNKLTENFGEEIGLINLSFLITEPLGVISLSHLSPEDFNNNILTINFDGESLMETMMDVLGLREE